MNRFLSLFSLLAVILWLLFSYLPLELFEGAQVSFPVAVMPLSAWIAAGIFVLFLLIQLILIRSAVSIGRTTPKNRTEAEASHPPQSLALSLRVHVAWEIFWTILPLILTIGVAVVGYQRWSRL